MLNCDFEPSVSVFNSNYYSSYEITTRSERMLMHKRNCFQKAAQSFPFENFSALLENFRKEKEEYITVYASITAKPFFQNRGYMVQRQQQVERNGVWLTNYVMRKLKIIP